MSYDASVEHHAREPITHIYGVTRNELKACLSHINESNSPDNSEN